MGQRHTVASALFVQKAIKNQIYFSSYVSFLRDATLILNMRIQQYF